MTPDSLLRAALIRLAAFTHENVQHYRDQDGRLPKCSQYCVPCIAQQALDATTELQPPSECGVCRKPFASTWDVFRCADCEMCCHRDCLRNVHFKEQIAPSQVHEFERTKHNLAVATEELRVAREELSSLDTTARELLDNARQQIGAQQALDADATARKEQPMSDQREPWHQPSTPSDTCRVISEYFNLGGFFNPEMMDHQKVRELMWRSRYWISGLLADAEATGAAYRKMLDDLRAAGLPILIPSDSLPPHWQVTGIILKALREPADALTPQPQRDIKANGIISPGRLHGKGSRARAAASAQIAKIPYVLARHIAAVWKP